jgi:hypothetical protein
MLSREELKTRFTYHEPDDKKLEQYDRVRKMFLELATELWQNCPESRELSIAISRLEEAQFWTNASIARR